MVEARKCLQKIVDYMDQYLDIMLNYRQSGHPGGSRSKVPLLTSLFFSSAARFDLVDPANVLGDRFILSAGHTVPVIYALLALVNEARHAAGAEPSPWPELRAQDLVGLRYSGGLSGHPEMSGSSLLMKWNSGPSGHGLPASVGQALALRRGGLPQVRVISVEGEGGLTTGASHESKNSAWGLGLGNLLWLIDWNDYGIDSRAASSVVAGRPPDWFTSYGWRVLGCDEGDKVEALAEVLDQALAPVDVAEKRPLMFWCRTRKGRGYGVYDAASHGKAHAMNSALFWQGREEFARQYNVEFVNFGGPAPTSTAAVREEAGEQLRVVSEALRGDRQLVEFINSRLGLQQQSIAAERRPPELFSGQPGTVAQLFAEVLPERLFLAAGTKASNREGFSRYASWLNALARKKLGQPLFLACSADLAASTGIAAFGQDDELAPGLGWYERDDNPEGVILPQEITEFTNSGLVCAVASVNFSRQPAAEFRGFYGACSTYGAFSYLKYGEMRLFSQMAQDCDLKMGKVLWVAGHSGPETAEDARTHFGIFSPTVTQLFPDGQVINLYPWEHNEVPVLLHAALGQSAPLIALHLTRPAVELPRRSELGLPCYRQASRGAYVARDYRQGQDFTGCVIVQGTMPVVNLLKLWPQLEQLNLKVVIVASPELFALQDAAYQQQVLSAWDRQNAIVLSNASKIAMQRWIFNRELEEYCLCADRDGRWLSGGTVDELMAEAGLSAEAIWQGLQRFSRRAQAG